MVTIIPHFLGNWIFSKITHSIYKVTKIPFEYVGRHYLDITLNTTESRNNMVTRRMCLYLRLVLYLSNETQATRRAFY